MPTSARKSSVGGGRRGPPQKYIRYRADDLQHGKRTGIAVGYVDRSEDGFEPFDKVISQADQRTPPKPRMLGKKKQLPRTPIVEEYDEDGEMSMELEDSYPNSPAAYFANGLSAITSSVHRSGSSSRPVSRRSDVDFDQIPSPRRESLAASSKNRSLASSRSSNLSRSIVPVEIPEDESEPEPINYDQVDEEEEEDQRPEMEVDSDAERTPTVKSRQRQSSGRPRPSFVQINQSNSNEQDEEEDLEEDEVERHMTARSSKAKGKSREVEQPQDEEMEDDIAQGLNEVDNMPEEQMDWDQGQDQQEEEEPQEETPKAKGRRRSENDSAELRPSKKARTDNQDENASKKKRGRPRKENNSVNVLREVMQDPNIDDDELGLRRSRRVRYKPLDWWRLEKVVYGRRESGTCLVPSIKEIRRVPKEEVQPLGAKHRRRTKPRSKSQSATVDPDDDDDGAWDFQTDPTGIVLKYPTGEEVTQRVAFTAEMVTPKPAANADFAFQKIFGDDNFMAAGQLVIPPNGKKPTKKTNDNTFIFYVIEGKVKFQVHKTSFLLKTGSMFLVPRGNMYFIENESKRDAKLFFAQARKSDFELEGSRSLSKSRTPAS